MKLNKAYNCAELSIILQASCYNESNHIFDSFSSLSHPIEKSLGFITQDNSDVDLSIFSGLIVDEKFSTDIDKSVVLFKTKNVMHSVSMLLAEISSKLSYTISN